MTKMFATQDRRRKLDPANDLDRFGNLYQCGYRWLQSGLRVSLANCYSAHNSLGFPVPATILRCAIWPFFLST